MPKIMISCPDGRKGRANGSDHGNDQVRVTGGDDDTAPVPGLHEAPQVGEKGSVGGQGRIGKRSEAASVGGIYHSRRAAWSARPIGVGYCQPLTA